MGGMDRNVGGGDWIEMWGGMDRDVGRGVGWKYGGNRIEI